MWHGLASKLLNLAFARPLSSHPCVFLGIRSGDFCTGTCKQFVWKKGEQMNFERVSTGVPRSCKSLSLRFLLSLLFIQLVAGFRSAPALAQVEAGTILGVVKDATGAVVPGANVAAKNLSTSAERSTQSGSDGAYLIPGVAAGTYQLTISSKGFQVFSTRVEVTVGARVTVDAQLSVSGQVTTVEVQDSRWRSCRA